ncbi:DUF1194 domain-containing protein [Aquicoccus sp. SCR17]|nr:DUF1194 domain-containing protein [Carideicomes alvinocaridis]
MSLRRTLAALALLAGCAATSAPASAACRQALALALDVSGSVDREEYALQLNGLAGALETPEVRAALLAMPETPVAIAVFEWSGPDFQRLLADWTVIDGEAALSGLVARLRAVRRTGSDPSTAIGAAMRHGVALLDKAPGCWRRTLDISGDGEHNSGPHPREVKKTLPPDLTINGLTIGARGESSTDGIGALVGYYTAYVIHGPDAFVETALGFRAYEAAMVRKLKRELESVVVGLARPPVPEPAGR